MSDIYLAITETPTVVTLTSAVINSAVASTVTVANVVTVALDANSLSALENVTVTVGAAITGTVTVSNFPAFPATQPVSIASVTIGSLPLIAGTVTANLDAFSFVQAILTNNTNGESVNVFVGNTVTIAGTVTANPTGTQTIAGSVTLGAGTAQIGSVTASISNFPATQAISIASVTIGNSITIGSLPAISGTVTANLSISSTAITSGSFTSLTSATLVPANTSRKMAAVYNLGAGQLFVQAGASATTLGGGFMVALSSGDFYECDYTTTTLSAIFATAGTASWVSH